MYSIKLFAIDIDGTLTINGDGSVNLDALSKLRYLSKLGYQVVYVTGRSSIEAFILAVFGGTTKLAIGENGGIITKSPTEHILLADKQKCLVGYNILKKEIMGVEIKDVFPRMTEIVLKRTFDIEIGRKILIENKLNLTLVDSNYAYHINEKFIDKSFGLSYILKSLNLSTDEVVAIGDSETDIPMFELCNNSITFENSTTRVKNSAKYIVSGVSGEGLINAIDLIIKEKSKR